MRTAAVIIVSLILCSCSDNNIIRFKEQKKDSTVLSGTFIYDSIPHGIVKTYNFNNRIISIENYRYGVLEGEAKYFYEQNGIIKVKTNFESGMQSGFKYTYNSTGKLLSKTNYFFGKGIGPYMSFDTSGNIFEYTFLNFENDMLYFCSFDKKNNAYTYPSEAYLIKATTEPRLVDGKNMLYIFLYLLNPPKLKLEYRICSTDENDSLITLKQVFSNNFYYEYYFTLKNADQKVAIVLDKYDSLTQKKSVIIKYLKTSYP